MASAAEIVGGRCIDRFRVWNKAMTTRLTLQCITARRDNGRRLRASAGNIRRPRFRSSRRRRIDAHRGEGIMRSRRDFLKTTGGLVLATGGTWLAAHAHGADAVLGPAELPDGTFAASMLDALSGKVPLIKRSWR